MELNSEGIKFNLGATLVKVFHISIIIYMSFGWIITNKLIWISILIFAPLFHIHWKTNEGKCILTNIEKRLRDNDNGQGTFIGGLSKSILNKELSDKTVSNLAYGIMYSSAFICGIRYLMSTSTF